MGFWNSQVIDLHLAGIHLDEVEVDILENGGEVMCLAELPDPSAYQGGDWTMEDVDGKTVMVPLYVSCASPTSAYFTDARGTTTTYVEHLDREMGTDWRFHPAYVGELLMDDSDRWGQHFYMWTEEARPFRPWSCKPLITAGDRTLYERVREASFRRLVAADWFTVDEICYLESYGEFVAETACVDLGVVKPPKGYKDPYGGVFDYQSFNIDYLRAVCADFARLCDARRYFAWSWDDGPYSEIESFTIGRFEDFLLPGDVEAYSFWYSTIARKGFVSHRLKHIYHRGDTHYEQAERWIA